MDYADKIRAMQAKRAIMAKAKAKKDNVLTPAQGYMVNPNTDYLNDPRETEFDPETELKYQMRDKLGMARGGKIQGTPPDNPMKDNKLVPMRSGEYVIPEPVVKAIGKPFFDNMIKKVTGKFPYGSPSKGFYMGGDGDWTPPDELNQNPNFGPGGDYNPNYEGSYYPANFMGADKGPKAPYIGYYGGKDSNPLYSWIPPEYRDFFAHHGGDWGDNEGGNNFYSKRIPGGIQIGGGNNRGRGMWGSDIYSILDQGGRRGGGRRGGGGRENWGNLGNLPSSKLSERPNSWNPFGGLPPGFTESNRFGHGAPDFNQTVNPNTGASIPQNGPQWTADSIFNANNLGPSESNAVAPRHFAPGQVGSSSVPAPGSIGGTFGQGSHGNLGNFWDRMVRRNYWRGGDPTMGFGTHNAIADYARMLPFRRGGGSIVNWPGRQGRAGGDVIKFGPNAKQMNQE